MRKYSIALAVLGAATAFAQPAKVPDIEAVSVKAGQTGETVIDRSSSIEIQIDNTQLRMLILQAFDIRADQLIESPDWLSSEVWSIEMKSPAPATQKQLDRMLQTVLTDRFHLRVHRETRMLPVFALTVGKDGHKLRIAREDEEESMEIGGGTLQALNSDLSGLTGILTGWLARPVIDKTALRGHYDFTVKWDPDSDDDIAVPPDIASVLRNQLGLVLKTGKAPVQVIVIDHVDRPSAN